MGSENSLLGFTHDEITEYREINRKYQKRLVSMRKKTIG